MRDLLLDRRPKDFDVCTDARPEDVRALFRNSRIIGRRFRSVHVLFGGARSSKWPRSAARRWSDVDPLEANGVAAADVDLLIRSDNAFGEAHEDAVRRDFTINALFYDLERGQILDWVGGMHDIERRVVRTIGEPETRFREDPIRILRAIKFAARLDLGIDPDVYDAMVSTRATLARAARPRLFEEILRLMRGGGAHRSIWLSWELGILSVLLPELASFLDDDEGDGPASRVWKLLAEVDRRTVDRGAPLDDIVLWTLLVLEPMKKLAKESAIASPQHSLSSIRSSSGWRCPGALPTPCVASLRSSRVSRRVAQGGSRAPVSSRWRAKFIRSSDKRCHAENFLSARASRARRSRGRPPQMYFCARHFDRSCRSPCVHLAP